MGWCYCRVQACAGGKGEVFSTLVREIWTNITGFIVDLLTSVEKNSTFSAHHGKFLISVLKLRF